LSLASAKQIGQAAEQWATDAGLHVVIAVTDDGGTLLYLARMDGAPLGSVQVAQRKAHTSISFSCESKYFQTELAAGVTALLTLDVVPFEGGVPLLVDGKVVGAIGVSGGTTDQDGSVARAGADKLAELLRNSN
jgi:uncharacterized protein GlcG (DUF336 family)